MIRFGFVDYCVFIAFIMFVIRVIVFWEKLLRSHSPPGARAPPGEFQAHSPAPPWPLDPLAHLPHTHCPFPSSDGKGQPSGLLPALWYFWDHGRHFWHLGCGALLCAWVFWSKPIWPNSRFGSRRPQPRNLGNQSGPKIKTITTKTITTTVVWWHKWEKMNMNKT